jgi:4,5-dihydroxyphthalate decarboxylase
MIMYPYDRMLALKDGSVQPEGIDLNFVPMWPQETFWRQLHHSPEFEVCELSLSGYLMTLQQGTPPFVAIPVFPSRRFRHDCIFIHTQSGIRAPNDFSHKRVGVPEYSMTAAVWLRGLLQHDYGVDIKTLCNVRAGLEAPGIERIEFIIPPDIHLEDAPNDNLNSLLNAGKIDAITSPIAPSSYGKNPQIKRLFEESESIEREYFKRTKIFPIMHVVAIKRDVYEANPWVAESLFKAFQESKAAAYRWLEDQLLAISTPWFVSAMLEQWRFFGRDPFAYGLDENKETLSALVQYSFEQGLSMRQLSIEELFAHEVIDRHPPLSYGASKEEIPPVLRRALVGKRDS